ncbi:carotenoid biosynthesis protein [Acidicapsa acidisoli]|uniref:carotenoid biosynthesis protein n=1 Tax=Acidicapsa acidisoli TaxID=1615681 RepID=UPI0021E08E53|nr:carotenoid biosynthesis protein [Acidicapsa acidisoli]
MNRLLRAASWLFFVGIMYLILTEAVWPWLKLPDLGNIGFTLVFVLFSITHCIVIEGARRTAMFFAISAIVSFVLEEVGVRTGLVYGAYHYSDMLGAKLGHVPILIPLAWFMMIYPSWMVARALLCGVDQQSLAGNTGRAVVAACVMTGWDMVMDPGMAASGNWIWEKGGAYFGVPIHNYFGWLFTTFLVYWIAGFLWRKADKPVGVARMYESLPVIVYAFFAVRYVASNRIPALQVVAMFSMGLPALLALIRIGVPVDKSAKAE